jgi:hypothetical protein
VAFLFAGRADAGVLNYRFFFDGTNDTPITDLALYAKGEGQESLVFSSAAIPDNGVSTLSHDVSFAAEFAMVLGVTERPSDGKADVMMFTSPTFANSVVGFNFSQIFDPATHPRHSGLIELLRNDDAAAIGAFLNSTTVASGFFDPSGAYRIIEWSTSGPPVGVPVPEPGSLALLVVAVTSLGFALRRCRQVVA